MRSLSRISALLVCSLLLNIAPVMRAHGQARQADTTTATAITPFFLLDSEATNQTPWYQSHMVADASGGVHAAYNSNQSVYYAHCSSGCGSLSNWTRTAISPSSSFDSLEYPTLVLDPQGHPRMMWFWGEADDFIYAQCNTACNVASHWSLVHVAILASWSNYAHDNAYFTLDTHGRPRFMVSRSGGFQYLTCDASCTVAGNWHEYNITISGYNFIDALKLVFNASDRPRAVGKDSNSEKLLYLECDGNCTLSSGWSAVALATVGDYYDDYGYSLRLDAQGHPRVAYYKADTDNSLYYAWSNANSTVSAGWHSYTLGLPPYDYSRSVDLAIDSQGRPRVAFATADGDLGYALCISQCQSTLAEWQYRLVETSADLEAAYPVVLGPTCISGVWEVEGYTSLALDPSDRPAISYHVRHVQLCQDYPGHYITFADRKGIRLAYLGDAGGPQYELFLPMIVH